MSVRKPELFTTNTLLVRETRTFMRSEFSIVNDDGTPIARVVQAGTLGRRMLGLGIKYEVFDIDEDGKDGDKLFTITDPPNIFGDTYKVIKPTGAQIATVKTKRFSLKSQLQLSIQGLDDVDADGGFRGRNYSLTSKGRRIAKIDRKFRGLKGAFTGKDTYALHLEPNLNEETRAAVIGTALIIDVIRRKQSAAVAGDAGASS
jgi:uncharacterized protein YxjI